MKLTLNANHMRYRDIEDTLTPREPEPKSALECISTEFALRGDLTLPHVEINRGTSVRFEECTEDPENVWVVIRPSGYDSPDRCKIKIPGNTQIRV